MNKQTRLLMDRETPFKVVELPDHEVRQYWTKGGIYGPQVLTVIFCYPDFYESKTGGCGFDKSASGLEWAWSKIGLRPKKSPENDSSLYDYRVGGNFYKVPKSQLKKSK